MKLDIDARIDDIFSHEGLEYRPTKTEDGMVKPFQRVKYMHHAPKEKEQIKQLIKDCLDEVTPKEQGEGTTWGTNEYWKIRKKVIDELNQKRKELGL